MILGIDIGGTNIKFGVTEDDYTLLKRYFIPTDSHRPIAAILSSIIEKANGIHIPSLKEYADKSMRSSGYQKALSIRDWSGCL